MFNRFVQADIEDRVASEGAGLGLAIAKFYVEILGGSIVLTSKTGVDSTFELTIPNVLSTSIKSPFSLNKAIPIDSCKEKNTENVIIIVAEDNEDCMQYISILFASMKGCKILKAFNGAEAVELLKHNITSGYLALLDMKMPIMNGTEACNTMKQIVPNLYIVVQTAYAFAEDREKALAAGFDDHIDKPLEEEAIKRIINRGRDKKSLKLKPMSHGNCDILLADYICHFLDYKSSNTLFGAVKE